MAWCQCHLEDELSPPSSLNRPSGTSPVSTTFPAFCHLTGAHSLPGPVVGCRAFCCLPCPPVFSGSSFLGLGCRAEMSWVNFCSGLACGLLRSLCAPYLPTGISRSCTGTWSTWPRLQTPTRTCSPCSPLRVPGAEGEAGAVRCCLRAQVREWGSGVAEATDGRDGRVLLSHRSVSQSDVSRVCWSDHAIGLFGRGVTPEEPGLEMAGGGPQEGPAVAWVLALLHELF